VLHNEPMRRALHYFIVPLINALLGGPAATWGSIADSPDFEALWHVHGNHLQAITSDRKAKEFVVKQLAPALNLTDLLMPNSPAVQGAVSDQPASVEIEAAVRLTRALSAWRLSSALRSAAQSDDHAALQTILDQAEVQRTWLLGNVAGPLHRAVDLATVLAAFPNQQPVQSDAGSAFVSYAAFLDNRYPHMTGGDSWLEVAERQGWSGIRHRLSAYWEDSGLHEGRATDESEQAILEAHYFTLRLRPVVTAYVLANAAEAQADAERGTYTEWLSLRRMQEQHQAVQGLVRLCGTWHWIVHNHQNHQDHKMTMVFPPPQTAPTGPHPTKIVVLGDSVYLRWEFRGGYQEDSLLFAGEGQRLEGTFTNSAGAWGSITGRRAVPCRTTVR
jgi:hypothetical protein